MDVYESVSSTSDTPAWLGFAAAGVTIFFFGTNFVPVKKFETGDGVFFQWIMCSSIWLLGLCVNAARYFPKFYPLAMLGGALWCSGNICVIPILNTIGLAQGILIWGSFNLLLGWASGRFGWFGLTPEVPGTEWLNYLGVACCVISAFIYFGIKSSDSDSSSSENPSTNASGSHIGEYSEADSLLHQPASDSLLVSGSGTVTIGSSNQNIFDRLSPSRKRVLGISLAVVSGVLYGINFAPVIYIQDNYKDASKNGLDYVFSHFCGIYATSTVFLLIYCGVMGNQPRVYPRVILPGFISGAMWAIADSGWFIANAALSEAVSFPIITTGPGVVAAVWGVFYLKEIKGTRNYIILCLAGSVAVAGSVMVGLSKS